MNKPVLLIGLIIATDIGNINGTITNGTNSITNNSKIQ